jgi:malto-oligosyltrehalose trehalohydrolase
MPFGAALAENGEAEFRLWAPAAARVDLRTEARGERATMAMPRCENGWRSIRVPRAPAGTLYQFVVDGGLAVPDPASRFQPRDVHGPSELIDPAAFDWPDAGWRGRPWHETVLYELHVGAFTPEGSYAGAAKKLDHLAALGVTAIELMPVAEAPGMRNWGYDGVLPFAPEHRYGRPDELKRLVAAAHARNIQVFLDVVFNHFGPEGNYLGRYAPQFFLSDRPTPWGAAIDFEGPGSRTVRDFFIHNALYWIEEFHIDGLRLDAVHAIFDKSQPHILEEIAEAVRGAESPERHVHLVLENDDNAAHYLAREPDGRPRHYAAQWSEDIHHALHHLVTGETAGHYGDFADAPVARLGRALAEGFAYQGERSRHRGGRRRGEPSAHLPPTAFVSFLQNHDMVGNRALSERITATAPAAAVRAAAATVLLAPFPPLLFMGEEWGAPQPFPFFCDFGPDLANAVRAGRRREMARLPGFGGAAARWTDPVSATSFEAAKLDWSRLALPQHRAWLDFYRALLAIRAREIVPLLAGLARGRAERWVHAEQVLEVRWRLARDSLLHAVLALTPDGAGGIAIKPQGRLLFATAPEYAAARPLRELPPWFAAFYLDTPEPAAA